MRRALRYAAASTAAVAATVAALWPVLDPGGRFGVLLAAAVALPVQIAAFGALVWSRRHHANAFFAAWVGGTLVRMGVLLLVGILLLSTQAVAPVPMLLALAGFFFGLLLLEPLFWGPGGGRTAETNGS